MQPFALAFVSGRSLLGFALVDVLIPGDLVDGPVRAETLQHDVAPTGSEVVPRRLSAARGAPRRGDWGRWVHGEA
jgi:hypothetical protein